MHHLILDNLLVFLAAAVDTNTALSSLLGLIVKCFWVAAVAALGFGAIAGAREDHHALGMLLVKVGVGCLAVSIVGTLIVAMTGVGNDINPTG